MGKSKTQSTGVDNVTAGRQHAVFAAGQALAGQHLAPVDPSVAAAQRNYQGAASAGNLGLQSLSGDQGAYSHLANPYQQNVTDAVNAQWGRQAANVSDTIAARAQAAGAFGGSREAIAQGQGLSDLANNQMQQIAGLQYQGFNDTQNRAAQLANLGMSANGAAAGIGQYQTQQAQAAQSHPFDVLQSANSSLQPHGQTQTQSGNLWGDVLGGAAAVKSFIP
jgi:hypothetical protein